MNTDPSPAAMAAAQEITDAVVTSPVLKRSGITPGQDFAEALAAIIDRHCPTAALHEALVAQEEAVQAAEAHLEFLGGMGVAPTLRLQQLEGEEETRLGRISRDAANKARDLRKAALAPTTEVATNPHPEGNEPG